MKSIRSSAFIFLISLTASAVLASSVSAAGLLGYYQSRGVSQNTAVNSFNTGISSYSQPTSYATPTFNAQSNFNRVGFNNQPVGGSGLTGFYSNNNQGGYSNSHNSNTGGLTSFYAQQMQANSFSCPIINRPDPTTCQGGQFVSITNTSGCIIDWRCDGGNFCPVVPRPSDSQCNGVWEPQYSASTQCLTHYFCDRTPGVCTMEYAPVCGELNGRHITYSNRCLLEGAGARFLYDGQCSHQPHPPVDKLVINRFNGPQSLRVGETGTWTVHAQGNHGDQLSYTIDWGENYHANGAAMRNRGSQRTTFTHQYSRAGTYTVRVTVRNQHNQSASATATVRVEDQRSVQPNITSFTGPNELRVGETGTWRVEANHPFDAPIDFSIDWGEYYTYEGSSSQVRWNSSRTFTHAYRGAGTYQVRVTASSGGLSVSRTLTVRVTESSTGGNLAPVVHGISGPTSLVAGQTGTWRVQASDPYNQDLMYQINWGDQGYGAMNRYQSQSGFVQNSAFTHQYQNPGTYTVTITVKNEAGKTATTSTTVRVEGLDQPYYPYSSAPTNQYNSYNNFYVNKHNQRGGNNAYFYRNYNWRY